MPKGVYPRSQTSMPNPPPPISRGLAGEPDVAAPDDSEMPDLVVPMNLTPSIDLSKPEDSPDQPEGEWSARHLGQFLARQPRSVVFIPKESWEPKGEDTYQAIGFQGHRFRVRKGRPESVPIQIAAVIEQSQEEFPTQQSQLRRRQITDIRDLPQDLSGRGMLGVDVSTQLGY